MAIYKIHSQKQDLKKTNLVSYGYKIASKLLKNFKLNTMSNNPVIVEETFSVSAGKIWNAITDKNEMKNWYFDLEEFRPEVGFEFRFWGGPEDGTKYLHICEITDVESQKLLAYNWRYDGYPGLTNVRFEITEISSSETKLKLSHAGLESFPADNPDFARSNFEEGWDAIIQTSLKNYLEQS